LITDGDGQLLPGLQDPKARGTQAEILAEGRLDELIEDGIAESALPPLGGHRHGALHPGIRIVQPVGFGRRGRRLVVGPQHRATRREKRRANEQEKSGQ
jgi:hypothetical protein